MGVYGFSTYRDPVTGCGIGSSAEAFQLCKQTYYLKQQNEILQKNQQTQQPVVVNNQEDVKELQGQIETLQSDNAVLKGDNAVLKAKSELFQQVEQVNTQLVIQLTNQTAKNDLFLMLIIGLAVLAVAGWTMFVLRIKHKS